MAVRLEDLERENRELLEAAPFPVEGETVEEVQESEEPEPVEQSPKPGLFDRVRVWVRGW